METPNWLMILPMHVVSNTSPLLNLAIIGRLDIVHEQFGSVVCPRSVFNECHPYHDAPGTEALQQAEVDGWLRVVPDNNDSVQKSLLTYLDGGESAAVSLALSTKAELILLDDREARQTAIRMGLRVAGIIGLLLRAKACGREISVRDVIIELREVAGFWIGDDVMRGALVTAREVDPRSSL
jgi:predicted nucleic acid-binding protein